MTNPDLNLFETEAPPPTSGVYAKVVVERGIDTGPGLDGLTYRIDGDPPIVGERVEVPLGRGGKPAQGIVIEIGGPELLGGFDPRKVKPITARKGSPIPGPLLALARWMAEYYICPLGMVLATMVPASVKQAIGQRHIDRFRPAELALDARDAALATLTPKARAAWDTIAALDPDTFPLAAPELALAAGLRTTRAVKQLADAGLLAAETHTEIRAGAMVGLEAVTRDTPPVLTETQARIVAGIDSTLGGFATHLIRGVTGSGKTEIYLHAIAAALAAGRSAIVLVPEIALTPQTADRFTRRFGDDTVAVLHSGLTQSQRHKEWSRVAAGKARVVVGARSAIFAPVAGLGIIVVDEEHDSSYKQDQLPRYNARDLAVKRAHLEGCPVVLGSATPSLESWANARSGKYVLHELTERAGGGTLPAVEILDMREERARRIARDGGSDSALHLLGPTLEEALERTLADDGQAILLLNRRGFAHYICCPDSHCGFVAHCDECDASLVLHKHRDYPKGAIVRCHHCLAEQLVPQLCPTCGKKLNVFGGGTQRAQDELLRKFISMGLEDGTTLLRLDSDSMRSASDYFHALSRFGRGEARVLLGTQMIAKGLDFHNVRLVGVLDADTAINIPDFRAAERTFQLVSQVAGRAGRGDRPGRVIVQTMNPHHAAIVHAAAHDYVTFADEELAVRHRAGLPPLTRMVRIVCRDENAEKAVAAATAIRDRIRELSPDTFGITGPAPCAVSRIAGQHRFEILVIGPRTSAVHHVLARLRAEKLVKSDANTAVDVDPLALL